jgi:hypothetical protein
LLIIALQNIVAILNEKQKKSTIIGESASTLDIRAIIATSLKEAAKTGSLP